MDTYIQLHREPKQIYIRDGKTGDEKIDELLPRLYSAFSVFQLIITTGHKFDSGFLIVVKTHDNDQREMFGDIYIEYQHYTHNGDRDHYTISCGNREGRNEPVIFGYEAVGEDFDSCLNDFIVGSSAVIKGYASRLNKMSKTLRSKVKKGHTGSKGFGIIVER